jgi:hypothetical protein
MSDTRALLHKITALRQRLEQAQGLVQEAGSAAVELLAGAPATADAAPLSIRLAAGQREQVLLDSSIRRLAGTLDAADTVAPARLTARLRGLLEQGRALVVQLRSLADDPLLSEAPGPDGALDPLADTLRSTVAMAETSLRLVQGFPDAASAQLRMSEGLEGMLAMIAERTQSLEAAVQQRRRHHERIDALATLLLTLDAGKTPELPPYLALAETIWAEAQQGTPLHFLHAEPGADGPGHEDEWGTTVDSVVRPWAVARFVAAHSLNVAQVVAHLVPHDPDLRRVPLELILAALLHEVGLLRVPIALLTQPEPLTAEQRGQLERHPAIGAERVTRFLPGAASVSELIACHHERPDGTGYPAGLSAAQLSAPAKFLAVAIAYAARVCPRPHRPAADPRTALTDTLLAAEKGAFDRTHAERLLQLSFYPVGSVVELADGQVGVVVATHKGRADLTAPARPVLALLTATDGTLLPSPQHLDLAVCAGRTIVRTLSVARRRQLLGRRYPELVA